jgi:4-carboxymuconolactone decarboxylase
MKGQTMKLIATLVLSVFLVASAYAQTDRTTPVQDSQTIRITRSGSRAPQKGPSEHFTGSVSVDPLFQASDPSRVSGGRVTFEPGARSAWHTQGDVVSIPPGQKHWHGAAPNTAMTHIAIQEQLAGKTADWLEKVTDAQYGLPPPAPGGSAEPTPAQRLMGDMAPKLVELTDRVLYGDVWERPELSKRDRSLVTVAALIAMNRPDQLRSHMTRARANGVTQEEMIEVITHLAFYAGWPSAVTAVSVAREVFPKN